MIYKAGEQLCNQSKYILMSHNLPHSQENYLNERNHTISNEFHKKISFGMVSKSKKMQNIE